MLTTDKDKVPNMNDIAQDKFEGITATLNINWNDIINYKCSHLLPCGVCEITNKMCPLNNWKPSWSVNDVATMATSEPWRIDGLATKVTPEHECVYGNKEEKKND